VFALPHLRKRRKLCLKRPESRPDLGEDDVELFDALDENCPMLEVHHFSRRGVLLGCGY
jgi:hypothetical protein